MGEKHNFSWDKLYLAVVFVFLYVPIVYLLAYSFNKGDTMNSFTGFSMRHFAELFSDTRLIVILLETFMLAFFVGIDRNGHRYVRGSFDLLRQKTPTKDGAFVFEQYFDGFTGRHHRCQLFDSVYDDRIVGRRHRARILDGAFVARRIQHSDRCPDGFAQASGNERVDGFCGI